MKKTLIVIFCIFQLAFRLWLSTQSKHGDMYNNLDWGKKAVQYGLTGFYDLPKEVWTHSRPNQPAGSILLHAISYQLNQSVSQLLWNLNTQTRLFPSRLIWWWENYGELVSIKIPSVLADFAIAAVLIKLTKKSWVGGIYLLTPPLWYNSSFWGQTDSIIAALAMWALYFLSTSQLLAANIFLGLSLAIKISWLPILPLYLIYLFKKFPTRRRVSILLIPITILLVFWPFHPQLNLPAWLFQLFFTRLLPGESAYATVNAFNLWHLIFGQTFVSDSTAHANLIGFGLSITILFICLYRLVKNMTFNNLLRQSMFMFWGVFLFSTRMHERYLYPIFPLLFALSPKPRMWSYILILLSFFYLANLYFAWWAPNILGLISIYSANFTRTISASNIISFIYVFIRL